jgi:hypothetical protein
VKKIDFSSKHHCLIRNKDGSLTPMDEPYYEVETVAPGTWKILSSGDYSYLAEGENEAIAIDTGYGAGNIREYLQTLTDKPLNDVVNTHDHFDHTANNAYFEKAYMSKETAELATIPFPSFAGIDFPTDYPKVIVDDGDVIDLGGRTLTVIKIPDHAVGSIVLLDPKQRMLFTGDEFMPMPMGKNLNVGVKTFFGYLEKLMVHRNEFDRLCAGGGVLNATLIDQYYECASYILEGNEGREKFNKSGPPIQKADPEGRIIYDRRMPHPEDLHHDEIEEGYARCMEHAGVRIVYDIRKVND